jgi:hypothetical protein
MRIWRKRKRKVCSRPRAADSTLLGRISPGGGRRGKPSMGRRIRTATEGKAPALRSSAIVVAFNYGAHRGHSR